MAVAGMRRLWRSRGWRARGCRARRVWLTGAAAVLAVLVAGMAVLTWPSHRAQSGGTAAVSPTSSGPPAAPPPGGGAGESGYDAGRAAAAPAQDASVAPRDASGAVPQQVPGVPVGATQRQLVRTAQLTVNVTESAAATRQVRTTAAAAGGLVVEEQTSERGAWLVLRVPAEALDKVIDDIAAIGSVTARTSQVVDSTAEVVDLDARVASQQASVARVRALLAQATSIGDVVAIESELARREADLDSLTNRLAVLRDQVAMSTLTLDLRTPSTGLIDDDDDRAVGFADGLDAGWRGLLALGTAVAAVIGFVLPFLPVLAVLFALGWAARRIVRARRAVVPSTPAPTPDS